MALTITVNTGSKSKSFGVSYSSLAEFKNFIQQTANEENVAAIVTVTSSRRGQLEEFVVTPEGAR